MMITDVKVQQIAAQYGENIKLDQMLPFKLNRFQIVRQLLDNELSVVYFKKNCGERRYMLAQLDVESYEYALKASTAMAPEHCYVTVKDVIKDEFRNINLNNVELVRKGKQIGVIVN